MTKGSMLLLITFIFVVFTVVVSLNSPCSPDSLFMNPTMEEVP